MNNCDLDFPNIIVQSLVFLIISYFLFYKSWLKSLGREVAKLSTISQLTEAKEDIKRDFNEKIEVFKSKLNEELAVKIEPLKSELAKHNITHQIEYAFIHKERASATVEIYKKLVELNESVQDVVGDHHHIISDADKERRDRIDRANNALADFHKYFVQNKIFFSKEFCTNIQETLNDYSINGFKFVYHQNLLTDSASQGVRKYHSEEVIKFATVISDRLPSRIEEIEEQIREILAINSYQK